MAFLDAEAESRAEQGANRRAMAAALPVFATSIFLSAFLLFSVQPLFAKLVLPKLGGSPGVWSVAMVFFQTMLLAGYGYAHILTKNFSLKNAAFIHLAVMLLAFVVLPLALPQGWDTPPQDGQALWLLGLFSVAVGLPFFAVAANSPLLQAWFARTGHKHAADPYFLYGASNIGSFASLILYIVLFEPTMVLSSQTMAWSVGFAVLVGFIGTCGLLVVSLQGKGKAALAVETPALSGAERPGWKQRAQWVALAFVPSGLLVAVTAHISTDIAAAPFLWVIPLALFLLTFVLAFARRQWFSIETLSLVVLALAILPFLTISFAASTPVWVGLPVHLGYFFLATLLAHSFLVKLRPQASELTEFYLWMSLGGVLGGAATTLLAPLVFDSVVEYPLLLLATLLCRPSLYKPVQREAHDGKNHTNLSFQVFLIGFSILFYGAYLVISPAKETLSLERSFFGVVRVKTSADGRFIELSHGTTVHGSMKIEQQGDVPQPAAYYHETGGMAQALFAVQEKLHGRKATMGVAGLGTGAILCHRKPGETWKSYEIDQAVVRAAANPALFQYVPQCLKGDPIIIGDARLKLAGEKDGTFDYLLIDAFSSDSIPTHLLTLEAFRLYRSKLAQDGVLTIHISNNYLELESVVAALAKELGMVSRVAFITPTQQLREQDRAYPSVVVVLANSQQALGRIATDKKWRPITSRKIAVWTDDYSNIPAAVIRHLFK